MKKQSVFVMMMLMAMAFGFMLLGPAYGQGDAVSTENVLYAFAPGKISIIEPISARVVKEITAGLEDSEWTDAVVAADNRLIFANDNFNAQVIVIDTEAQEIIERIDVGPAPVHLYNPLHGDDIWTHSDAEGAFYVIDINTLEVTHRVVTNGSGHGKLRYHESLGNKAFATNTNVPAVFVVDLETKEVLQKIDLCEGQGGTHGKAFSPHSQHAYFECTAGLTAILDSSSDTVVRHLPGAGQLFESPDDTLILIADKRNNEVRVLDATQGSELVATIAVTGAPDKIFFHQRQEDGKTYAFTANTQTPVTTVIDLETFEIVKEIAAGDIDRPEGSRFLHRNGLAADRFFFTPASGDGVVAIIDAETLLLHAAVPAGKGVDNVVYVGTRSED